jgi:hypothetical protein
VTRYQWTWDQESTSWSLEADPRYWVRDFKISNPVYKMAVDGHEVGEALTSDDAFYRLEARYEAEQARKGKPGTRLVIAGPRARHHLLDGPTLPWMELDVIASGVPAEGEVIILNGGGSYVVERRMWFVNGPENSAYWGKGDYRELADIEAVHVDVRPDDLAPIDRRAEGVIAGRRACVEDLAAALKFTEGLDGDALRAVLASWIKRETEAGK